MLMLTCALSDEELFSESERIERCIEKLANGNSKALEDFFELTRTQIFAFALSKTQNYHDAEDILQQTIIEVWKYAQGYVPQGTPKAWIFTIEKNLIIKKFKDRRHYQWTSEDPRGDMCSDYLVESEVVDHEFLEVIMDILSDTEQQIITLSIVSGMKNREIADILEMPLGTVCSYRSRAISKMKKYNEEVCHA